MKLSLLTLFFFLSLSLFAQNPCNIDGVVVDSFNFGYSPQVVTIEPGETVVWVNIGGFHNAQGTFNSITQEPYDNPEPFSFPAISGNSSGVCIGAFTFTVPGVYNYDCSVGFHAINGMVGQIIVGTGGCTDALAPNFNPDADFDDGSCLEGGCTDPFAANFNPSAGEDDGSCLYEITFRVDVYNQQNISGFARFASDINGFDGSQALMTNVGYGLNEFTILMNEGQTIEYRFEGSFGLETVPAECGVSDGTGGFNRSFTASGAPEVLDIVCIDECAACQGCADAFSLNFNPVSDGGGNCAGEIVYGCTYIDSENYALEATIDDGSCTFSGQPACPGDFNNDGIIAAGDLLGFLAVFGQTCD
ncbi:MAG: plastocyanin/azurin family copper-binding protein [Flavobacteriales bacterium]|nr:plastocyanin/azurin family copper-binding protein [Flavobacteriales bacterium]